MESVTIGILEKEIVKKQKQLDNLNAIMKASPVSKILEIRCEAAKIISENDGSYEAISKKINSLAVEEKQQLLLSKKQSSPKLLDNIIRLQGEINEIGTDISILKIRRRC